MNYLLFPPENSLQLFNPVIDSMKIFYKPTLDKG